MKKQIIEHLELIGRLLELNGENEFKIKAYTKAIDSIHNLEFEDPEVIKKIEWKNIKGIGDSISKVINEFITTGNSNITKILLQKTPDKVIELSSSIRGLSLKRISKLWQEHNITSIEELLEKCNKNEFAAIKGYGDKFQEKIKSRILFYYKNKGKKLYSKSIRKAQQLLNQLNINFFDKKHVLTGEIGRQDPVLNDMQIVSTADADALNLFLKNIDFKIEHTTKNSIEAFNAYYGKVIIFLANDNNWGSVLFKTSATHNFEKEFKIDKNYAEEQLIFETNNTHFIPMCLRYDTKFLDSKYVSEIKTTIKENDIKGLIHCHSKWSDGEHSIEAMAKASILQGLKYMVITDHSETSYIANGMTIERVLKQHEEITELNKKLFPFKIFKGIECDILGDGSLDYGIEFLKNFDLVIASIHQNLEMEKDVATKRVIAAIRNPCTHIMGHISGRLLLNRKGYDLDYDLIFDECVKNNVAIELNANPFRLDIDWKYLSTMKNKNIKTSINPDAHSIDAISDIQFGIALAQKMCLQASDNISSLSLPDFEKFLLQVKQKL